MQFDYFPAANPKLLQRGLFKEPDEKPAVAADIWYLPVIVRLCRFDAADNQVGMLVNLFGVVWVYCPILRVDNMPAVVIGSQDSQMYVVHRLSLIQNHEPSITRSFKAYAGSLWLLDQFLWQNRRHRLLLIDGITPKTPPDITIPPNVGGSVGRCQRSRYWRKPMVDGGAATLLGGK